MNYMPLNTDKVNYVVIVLPCHIEHAHLWSKKRYNNLSLGHASQCVEMILSDMGRNMLIGKRIIRVSDEIEVFQVPFYRLAVW